MAPYGDDQGIEPAFTDNPDVDWQLTRVESPPTESNSEVLAAKIAGPADDVAVDADTSAPPAAGQSDAKSSPSAQAAQWARQIIYTCQVDLVVENYAEFERSLPNVVAAHGGYISKREANRQYNDGQSGQWIIRVPSSSYHDFLSGIDSVGFAERRVEDAQDVTEEFVDVDARLRNKKQLEHRILTMLEDRTGKLTDVLQIENELARVREMIERMEGRLRYLRDRTALATVTIHCREEAKYTPASAPTFGSRLSGSLSTSIRTMLSLGENLVIAAVTLAPWIVVLIPIAILMRRKWNATTTTRGLV